MPEKHLPNIRAALARGMIPVRVNVSGDNTQSFEGEARFLDSTVDTTTGTIRMKAVLANTEERLTPGQFLNVSLVLETLRDAVVVRAEAVQQGPDGAFVYVLKADASAEVRKVEIAVVRDGQAAAARGLDSGETVVTDGQLSLTPGGKVKVKTPATPAQKSG